LARLTGITSLAIKTIVFNINNFFGIDNKGAMHFKNKSLGNLSSIFFRVE
jgi:hypothetical protein